MSMNKVLLEGRLTYNPELRTTPNGVSVLKIQIACDRRYQTKEQEKKSDFIDCTAFRNTADFISKYFKKGDPIEVEGFIGTSNYTDKEGNRRKSTSVMIENVSFVTAPAKRDDSASVSSENGSTVAAPMSDDFENIDDDDLPF